MLAAVIHILPLTTIRRERLLPVPGKVLVRKGQKVGASDVLAEANLSPEHLLMDLARGLGMPVEQTEKHIHCKAGDQVAEGDVLAGPVGLARRVVRSPRSGRVVVAGEGQILIEAQAHPYELKAALPGTVIDLIPERGAILETTGALVQGVWGNGGIDSGLLFVLATAPDQVLTADRLDVSLRGSMILAAHCEDVEVLKTAGELPLRGLVLSSMNPSLIPEANKLRFPIMVIEGFGRRPMNSAAFKLLSTNEKHEIALNAEPLDRHTGKRPEIIIPLPASGEPPLPKETDFFEAGQQVRVIQASTAGKIGTITQLCGKVTLPSGLRALAAEIRLEDGESVILPLANLEVLA